MSGVATDAVGHVRCLATDAIVARRCRRAASWGARLRGWIGGWSRWDGCWLERTGAVHTCGLGGAVDLVWLRAGAIVGLRLGLRPWRAAWWRGAEAVLELPAGGAAGLAVGQRLVWEPGD